MLLRKHFVLMMCRLRYIVLTADNAENHESHHSSMLRSIAPIDHSRASKWAFGFILSITQNSIEIHHFMVPEYDTTVLMIHEWTNSWTLMIGTISTYCARSACTSSNAICLRIWVCILSISRTRNSHWPCTPQVIPRPLR